MTTTNLREKINMLTNMIQAEDLQIFQAQIIVDSAAKSTGDAQVDQAMQANANNSKAQVLASTRRMAHCQEVLTALTAELAASGQGEKAAASVG